MLLFSRNNNVQYYSVIAHTKHLQLVRAKVTLLKNVNHFFQVSPDAKIESVYFNEETFSKVALQKIKEWIQGL